eukprot:6519110-Prymnesium_polylepis.1
MCARDGRTRAVELCFGCLFYGSEVTKSMADGLWCAIRRYSALRGSAVPLVQHEVNVTSSHTSPPA